MLIVRFLLLLGSEVGIISEQAFWAVMLQRKLPTFQVESRRVYEGMGFRFAEHHRLCSVASTSLDSDCL